jgi:hypothetical protein
MHFKNILFLVLMGFGIFLKAQPDIDPNTPLQQQNINTEENIKTKLGVKFTMGMHTFKGTAFDDPRLSYGFGMGVYHLIHLNKQKSMHLHWELNFTFKGSKFNEVNDTSYSKISLSYMELPVLFSFRVANNKKNLGTHVFLGGQFGVLFRSNINKTYGVLTEVKTNLPFRPIDVMPVLGVRQDIGSGMSIQLCAKLGLINIWTNTFYERSQPNYVPETKNKDYRDLTPSFKDGTHTVKNAGIELSFMF